MKTLALLLAALSPDDAAKAQELLNAAAAALKGSPAVEFRYLWRVKTAKEEADVEITVAAKRPNLLRFTEKEEKEEPQVTLLDGKTVWSIDPGRNEFSKIAQTPFGFNEYAGADPLRTLYFKGASRLLFRATDVSVSREKLGAEDCRTVSWARKIGRKRVNRTEAWIDSRSLPLRVEVKSESGGEESGEVFEYKSIDLRPVLADDAFAFKPRAGAKEIEGAGDDDKLLPTGSQAPDFEATDLDGKSVKLSDFKGKVVLLNFWFHD